MMDHCFDVSHRHIVLTMDDRLRPYFKRDRKLLNILFESAYETCASVVRKAGKKSEELAPGVIAVLHTYGRDLKWNPHVHCLVTEGGVTSAKVFKALSYINYESFTQDIPENQFKMVRYYGAYSSKYHRFKNTIKKLIDKAKSVAMKNATHYQRSLIACFNINSLKCPCGATMVFIESFIPPG